MITLTTVVMLVAISGTPECALAADGDSDGSGGGQNNPLTIVNCVPADGATGVTGLQYIKIAFSKNVAYMTVRDSNMKCFSLWSDGEMIPSEIIIADDQIEREKRSDVLIKPLQPLKAGATIQVEIAPEFQSKSGVTLGKKAIITFTMAAEGKALTNVSPEEYKLATGVDSKSAEGKPGTENGVLGNEITQGRTSGNTGSPTLPTSDQNQAGSADQSNSWLWVGLGAALVAITGLIYRKLAMPRSNR